MTQLLAYLDWTMILRLLVAAVLGGAVGFERERSGKVAGLRTHTLVSLGSALLVVISIKLFFTFPSVGGQQGFDYRLISNIMVGIGFIGAGTILRRENRIEGTTTAASLWVVAAIGIASGFGFYQEAVITTVVVYIVLAGLWLVEKYLTRDIRYKHEGIFGELNNSETPHHNHLSEK
ncbi:MAG: MgtC/SapB family protein [Patescibacteria group bacterium]